MRLLTHTTCDPARCLFVHVITGTKSAHIFIRIRFSTAYRDCVSGRSCYWPTGLHIHIIKYFYYLNYTVAQQIVHLSLWLGAWLQGWSTVLPASLSPTSECRSLLLAKFVYVFPPAVSVHMWLSTWLFNEGAKFSGCFPVLHESLSLILIEYRCCARSQRLYALCCACMLNVALVCYMLHSFTALICYTLRSFTSFCMQSKAPQATVDGIPLMHRLIADCAPLFLSLYWNGFFCF